MEIVSSKQLYYLSSTNDSPHDDGYHGNRSGTKFLGPCWPLRNSPPRRKPLGSPTILATASAPGFIPVRINPFFIMVRVRELRDFGERYNYISRGPGPGCLLPLCLFVRREP